MRLNFGDQLHAPAILFSVPTGQKEKWSLKLLWTWWHWEITFGA